MISDETLRLISIKAARRTAKLFPSPATPPYPRPWSVRTVGPTQDEVRVIEVMAEALAETCGVVEGGLVLLRGQTPTGRAYLELFSRDTPE